MPAWSISALLAAAFIGAHYLALRAASGRIADDLGALVLEGSAAVGLLGVLALRVVPHAETTRVGFFWSMVSGLCITGATTLLFSTLRLGGPVASSAAIVLGGGVTLAAVAAPFLFAEGISARRALGIVLGVAAMAVLATEKR